MSGFRSFLKSGHSPTLFAAFLYFAFSCCIWVLNGAMAPFISETFNLSPAQKGLMLSIPILAGALMRFPLGILSQYIGRKKATLVEMGLIAVAMLFGFFFVHTFNDLLAMGVLLGIAGASFGVALSLGAGSFPAKHKGLAMGLVGAGNVGDKAKAQLDLSTPPLDFVRLGEGMGVASRRATTTAEFVAAFEHALRTPGPHLIEAIVPPTLAGLKLRVLPHILQSLANLPKPIANALKRKIAP